VRASGPSPQHVLNLLWRGIVDYMKRHDVAYDHRLPSLYTTDAAEISLDLRPVEAGPLCAGPRASSLRVRGGGAGIDGPRRPDRGPREAHPPQASALVRSYLRIGAKVAVRGPGQDFARSPFMMLDVAKMSRDYLERFGVRTLHESPVKAAGLFFLFLRLFPGRLAAGLLFIFLRPDVKRRIFAADGWRVFCFLRGSAWYGRADQSDGERIVARGGFFRQQTTSVISTGLVLGSVFSRHLCEARALSKKVASVGSHDADLRDAYIDRVQKLSASAVRKPDAGLLRRKDQRPVFSEGHRPSGEALRPLQVGFF